jgi:hypothetical protein
MKPAQLPQTLIILSIIVVALTFLAGVLHAFDTARAAPDTPAAISGHLGGYKASLTPTPVPTPVPVSGDTTGIIGLAMVIVVIVLVGAVMGTNRPMKKKTL